jgi:hypothetical protein
MSTFISGQWNTVCDQCGFEFKSGALRKRWDGLMVCQSDWEPRQPQDFVHGVADYQAPPWTRPEGPDIFVLLCTAVTSQGLADIGVSDCAKADSVMT